MKTKNLLFLILLLGFSINSFSQEEVTIKQAIKNGKPSSNSLTGDVLYRIKVNTSLPVTIKDGKQNAIYLTGDFDSSKDIQEFCIIENGELLINSPKKGKSITLDLVSNIQEFVFNNNSNVEIKKDFSIGNQGEFIVDSNSIIKVLGSISGNDLQVEAKDNSKIDFSGVSVHQLNLKLGKGSDVQLKGGAHKFILIKADDSKLSKDNFTCSYLLEPSISPKGDTIYVEKEMPIKYRKEFKFDYNGNLIQVKGDTIKLGDEKSTIILKELSDAFAEVAKELNEGDSKEDVKPIADAFKIVAQNLDQEKSKESKKKSKKKESKVNSTLQLGYGVLGWSNKVSNVDNLLDSPKGQYSLSYSDSWSLGFRYEYKFNKRLSISTGLGYESNIFRFENNVMLTDINGGKRIDFDTTSLETESRLVARYVTVPLFVKFKVHKSFNVHVGAIAGVNFRTSSTGFKRDYEIPNAEVEERWGTKYDNFKPLKLDVQAGFGWGSVNFYAKYSLIPLFKDNKEVAAYPFSVGVSLGL